MKPSLTSKAGILSFLHFLADKFQGLEEEEKKSSNVRSFSPLKSLIEKDHVLVDMLNSHGHEQVCFCICDPDVMDCPIIFASEGFCNFTGYNYDEIEGRNCRFLQGPKTSKEDVDAIRKAIKEETEVNVNLLNYRKDGATFVNQFFLAPLHYRDDPVKAAYYIGVQCSVPTLGPGQMPANPGWVYTQGNHA
uniref:PAS domain-containing protein n=1 Tax=Chaetoceros debilis TaxID=122233 RepID=A0A7S3QJQ0_9STRA|mmetsp:Transcript_11099/g.16822  ORF Transcript_11099/g.16822 Transcript_11099/m.16822 type:complete len:191 (+) Transcript_11099:167-739(+)|eukprot:CAMPEP_0194090778 /NCGR_PEP_ID=MMETSP0149-20130528/40561_1 /TAXON_ID=122233 /ORGANISM="Chaetoceros debilis, Strain MM31A-1" /LENGTH=190 /DNA_ID=CAMNT_0038775159 /DNA_START=45 /DNA_END=617 /DNA_ORIENTATION=+